VTALNGFVVLWTAARSLRAVFFKSRLVQKMGSNDHPAVCSDGKLLCAPSSRQSPRYFFAAATSAASSAPDL
jgi:hypothetical protein